MAKWRIDEINFLKEHYNLGMTADEIANKLGRSVGSVHRKAWRLGLTIPVKNIADLEPSLELSYLLGVRYGDAKIPSTDYSFGLMVKDLDFAEEFKNCLDWVVPRNEANIIPWRGYYHIRVWSKDLHDFMVLPLEKQKFVIERYPSEFCRGFFDSEGGVGHLFIYADNTDISMLLYVKELLQKYFSITVKRIYPGIPAGTVRVFNGQYRVFERTVYRLYIGRKDNLVKFFNAVGFTILRKEEKLGFMLAERGWI